MEAILPHDSEHSKIANPYSRIMVLQKLSLNRSQIPTGVPPQHQTTLSQARNRKGFGCPKQRPGRPLIQILALLFLRPSSWPPQTPRSALDFFIQRFQASGSKHDHPCIPLQCAKFHRSHPTKPQVMKILRPLTQLFPTPCRSWRVTWWLSLNKNPMPQPHGLKIKTATFFGDFLPCQRDHGIGWVRKNSSSAPSLRIFQLTILTNNHPKNHGQTKFQRKSRYFRKWSFSLVNPQIPPSSKRRTSSPLVFRKNRTPERAAMQSTSSLGVWIKKGEP